MCAAAMSVRMVGVLVMVSGVPALGQNIVGNAGFETPPAGPTFVNRGGPGAMAPWDVGSNIDHIGAFWVAAEGAQSVDLNGSNEGTVSQSLTTIPGQRYRIRYALSENFHGVGDKSMDVVWGEVAVGSPVVVHNPARTSLNMMWEYRTHLVTAVEATTVLSFESTTRAMNGNAGFAPFYGPVIDDVSVTAVECCPADFNCDGRVNSQDFFDFLSVFFANSPSADFNVDGMVNSQDFFDFLTAFFAGC